MNSDQARTPLTEDEVDRLLNALQSRLIGLLSSLEEGRVKITRRTSLGNDIVSILNTVIVSAGIPQTLRHEAGVGDRIPVIHEPLFDVFDDAGSIRVIATIPGVKPQDVSVQATSRSLSIRVRKGDAVYSREIPCKVKASKIRVESITENNSVLEIVFRKPNSSRAPR